MNVYIDMDGTLTEWRKDATIEEITAPGFFLSAKPCEHMIKAVRDLLQENCKYNLFILSSTFTDDHSAQEKRAWIKTHLPEMPESHIILAPYGHPKGQYISCSKEAVLIDDNTDMLFTWPGVGVKIYNGVNGTKGRWTGYSLHSSMKPEILKNQLLGILSFCEC